MKRRQLLTLLATAGTGGCLSFQEAGQSNTTTRTGTGTTAEPNSTQQSTDTPSDYASTAASVETVQTLPLDITALSAAGSSYSVATYEQVQLRKFGSSTPKSTLEITLNSPVLELTDSACYVGSRVSDSGASTIHRFDPESGQQQAQTQIEGYIEGLTAIGNLLVCSTVEESSAYEERYANRIIAVDRTSLEQQWTNAVGNDAFPSSVTRLDDTLHVGFSNFLVGFAVSDGTIQYRAPLTTGYPVAYQGDLIADVNRKLRRINTETLEYEWSVGSEVAGRPVFVGDSVAAPTTDGIMCATLADGQQRWSRTLEDVSGLTPDRLVYQDGLLWYGTATEELYGLVPTTGETAFSMDADLTHIAATTQGVVINSGYETLELQIALAE